LYTSVFAPGAYGVITELYAYVAFFNVVYTYGLETAFFRFATKTENQSQEVYNNAQSLIIISSLLLSGLLFAFAPQIAQLLEYPDKEHLVEWLAMIMGVDAILAIPYAKLRLDNKAWTFAITKLSNIGLNIFLNIFLIVLCPAIYKGELLPGLKPWIDWFYNPAWSVEYVFLSNLLANAALMPVFWHLNRYFNFSFNKRLLKSMMAYAYPLLFMGLAGVTNEMLSRVLLKYWLPENFYPGKSNLYILGIFGACYKLAIFMNLTVQAFKYAAEPFFFSKGEDKNSPALFARVMHWFVIIC
jgi:O-antigen/teichoic acid export membrane protein